MSSREESQPDYLAASKYQGDIASGYVAKRENDPSWRWETDQVEQYLASHPAPLEILDVPFGTGRFAPLYLDAGWTVHGCDISSDMLAEAERLLGPEAFARCDVSASPAEHMPYEDASVDVVLSCRFLQWLPDIASVDAVLAEFARVARSELFVQLRVPAEPRQAPDVFRASEIGPFSKRAARAVRRRLVRSRVRANITSHSEPEVLGAAATHGWVLENIGRENPFGRGVRFYRFSKG